MNSADDDDDDDFSLEELRIFDTHTTSNEHKKSINDPKYIKKFITAVQEYFTCKQDDSNSQPESVQWFKDMQELLSYSNFEILPKKRTAIFNVLYDCLISHEWDDLNRYIRSHISREIRPMIYMLWKVSMEIGMRNDSYVDFSNLIDFFKSSNEVNILDVALDFGLYLISIGKFDDAYSSLLNIPSKPDPSDWNGECDDQEKYTRLLVSLYIGLIFYAKWEIAKVKIEELESDLSMNTDNTEEMKMLYMSKSDLQIFSNKAVECFKKLKDLKGVFDVFIEKYIIILTYENKIDEALEVMTLYAQNNSSNPNVYRYIYDYCETHEIYVDKKLTALRKFCDLIPSHEYGLILHSEMMKNPDTYLQSLHIIFDLLDYHCWKYNKKMWQRLLNQLCDRNFDIKSSSQFTEVWDIRKDWWPSYHFSCQELEVVDIHDSTVRELLHIRMLVSIELMGKSNIFSSLVQEKLDTFKMNNKEQDLEAEI